MKTKKNFIFIKNKKYTKNTKKNKLNKIYNKKKSKILLLKHYNNESLKKNKNKLKKTLKRKFKNSPENYLPLENLFNNKNMNKLNINVNPYISDQIIKSNKKNKEKIDHIENVMNKKYKDLKLKNKTLIKKLYTEILSRDYNYTKDFFESYSDYSLYLITEKKLNYPKLVFETNCGKQFIFMDFNKVAENFNYFKLGNIDISDNYLIFSVDIYGNDLYHIFLKPLHKNKINDLNLRFKIKTVIETHNIFDSNKSFNLISSKSNGDFILFNDNIYFISSGNSFNSKYIYSYDLYDKKLEKIYTLNEIGFFITLFKLNNRIFMYKTRYDGSSIYVLDNKKFINIIPFKRDNIIEIDEFNNIFYLLENYKYKNAIYKTNNFKTRELIHKSSNKLDIFENLSIINDKYLICTCRRLNEIFLVIINLCNKETNYLKILTEKAFLSDNKNLSLINKKFYEINYIFTEKTSITNDFYLNVESFLLPKHTLYINLDHKKMHILDNSKIANNMMIHDLYKKQFIYDKSLMNYDNKNYEDKLIFIPKKSNVAVYLMYKKGLKLNNKNKCLMIGYGSYRSKREAEYISTSGGAQIYASLMDRGFIVAITYIRGDDFGGYDFHKKGRLKERKNTYSDFISIAKYLINNNYTEPERLAIYGRSAGGLLIGNVINMEPELFKLAIMGVPFLMPVKVMKNKKNPLAFESHYEFGNPLDEKELEYVKKFSPYQQINYELNYPNIFIFTNMYDSKTPYNESYNYYNKIKNSNVFKNNKKDLIFYLNNKYGHKQSSKKLENYYEFACYLSLIINYIK